jgi:hypothetical protein
MKQVQREWPGNSVHSQMHPVDLLPYQSGGLTTGQQGEYPTPSLSPQEEQRPPAYLKTDEFAASSALGWWYRLFAPTPPIGRLATLKEREQVRRGRLASIILAVELFLIQLPVIPVVASAPNHAVVLPWFLAGIVALLAAIYFNRRGHLTVAGLLMVGSIEVTMIVKIITTPGGISVFYLPQFDILIQPILIAVALLAPWTAFAVAGFNVLFIIAALSAGPHAPDLTAALHTPSAVGDLFAVPVMVQILTAFFGWITVRNLLAALKRADQAEQIAALEHMLAKSRDQLEERNKQLEEGINAIIQTLQQVSNGQLRARVMLPSQNDLWPMVKQINNFFDRYQRRAEADAVLDVTRGAATELATEIYQSGQQGRHLRLPPRRGTPVDAVIVALSALMAGRRNGGGTPENTF